MKLLAFAVVVLVSFFGGLALAYRHRPAPRLACYYVQSDEDFANVKADEVVMGGGLCSQLRRQGVTVVTLCRQHVIILAVDQTKSGE